MACQELVHRLRPFVTTGATWQDVCAAAMPGCVLGQIVFGVFVLWNSLKTKIMLLTIITQGWDAE